MRTNLPTPAPRLDDSTAPDLEVWRGDDLAPGFTLPVGELWASADFGNGVSVHLVRTPDGWVLQYPSVGEFRITPDLRSVTAHAAPGKSSVLPLMLGASLLSWWLNLRGEPILHASAVVVRGSAVAFMGSSGTGKSTLATLLCAEGAALITDDALRLTRQDGAFHCHFGPGELRLRPSSAGLAGSFAPERVRLSADGRTSLQLGGAGGCLPRLRAVLIPRPLRGAAAVQIERLTELQASYHLNGFARSIGWRAEAPLRRQFEWFADLARGVPVGRITVPWGPPFAADLGAQVLGAVAGFVEETAPGMAGGVGRQKAKANASPAAESRAAGPEKIT